MAFRNDLKEGAREIWAESGWLFRAGVVIVAAALAFSLFSAVFL